MKHLVAPHLVFSCLDAEGYQVIMPPIIRPALGTGVASEGGTVIDSFTAAVYAFECCRLELLLKAHCVFHYGQVAMQTIDRWGVRHSEKG